MKNATFLFALAISATLMITTSGCKKTGLNNGTIYGTTRIPGSGPEEGVNKAPKTGGIGDRENLTPIAPNNTSTTSVEPTPAPPAAGPVSMEFPTNGTPFDIAFDKGTRDEATLAPDTVYFELDSSAIRKNEYPKLDHIAAYFKTPNNLDGLMVEGHCDERGTEQYNVALGDKRALAIREYLINLGVEPGRIRTVSFGEAKPVDPGHNEAAWSKNRRGAPVLFHAPK